MDTVERAETLLNFFKALADANRLKIVGLLARQELSVEQLAAILDLRPSTVSHHLARLAELGLVSARAESYYNIYRLETNVLESLAQELLSGEVLQEVAADVDLDAYDARVVKNYTLPDGRLKTLPTQLKKMQAILRYVAQAFEPGVRYSEKQVNDILGRFHEDVASLRRELVEAGMMAREVDGSAYWRLEA